MNITEDRQFLSVIRKLIVSLRVFQAESIFCEDITFNQFTILDYINTSGILEMSDLHRLLSVEKSTTTRMIEPLAVKGYLTKTPSVHDSRAVELRLTPEGKKVHQTVSKCISDFMTNMNNSIPKKNKDDVLNAVEVFINSLETCCKPGECRVKK